MMMEIVMQMISFRTLKENKIINNPCPQTTWILKGLNTQGMLFVISTTLAPSQRKVGP
jgi:hypothetical protein